MPNQAYEVFYVGAWLPRARHCAKLPEPSACVHPVSVKHLQSVLRRTRTLGVSARKVPPYPSWSASYASVAPSTKRSQHLPGGPKLTATAGPDQNAKIPSAPAQQGQVLFA